MRWLLFCLGLVIFTCVTARAQQQENKLVDRLLRPDTTLSNPAQNKKFNAVEGTSIDRKFEAKQFYAGTTRPTKSFWGAKSYPSKNFGTARYARAESVASGQAGAKFAKANARFETNKSSLVHSSSFAGKSAKRAVMRTTGPSWARARARSSSASRIIP